MSVAFKANFFFLLALSEALFLLIKGPWRSHYAVPLHNDLFLPEISVFASLLSLVLIPLNFFTSLLSLLFRYPLLGTHTPKCLSRLSETEDHMNSPDKSYISA